MRDPDDHEGYMVAVELCAYPDDETLADAEAYVDFLSTWVRDVDMLFGRDPTGQA
jgi:hypothetical protein